MTLADFVRKYLEDRRKVCEDKARFSKFGRDVHYYTRNGENVNSSESSNPRLFSNSLQESSKDDDCTSCKVNKQSIVTKLITLPDGKVQIETIIKDGKGNEEKRVTYQENGKKVTVITRTDPSGRQKIERNVGESEDTLTDFDNSVIIFPEQHFGTNQNADSGYDYWFNKLFKPDNNPQEFWKNDLMPFDFNNVEENISKLFKIFENDSFTSPFKKQWSSNEDSDSTEWFVEDFSPHNEPAGLADETQKFLEQYEKDAQKPKKNKKNKKGENDLQTQVDSIMKNFISPKPPSLFGQFAERAVVEIPEEKTPMDRFMDPDEDANKKRISIFKETTEFIKKLDNYFNKGTPIDKNAIYSDIQPQDQDIALFVPKPDPTPNLNDFGSIIAKHFGQNRANLRVNTTSKMRFTNGNLRTETLSKDNNGNMEKSVTYQVGDKTYNIVTVTSPSGERIKKQRKINFSEAELPNFKKQWDARYHSDFSD